MRLKTPSAWQPSAAIIFCKTRNRVETVADILRPKGAEALHGGMSQAERTRVMNRFREGRTNVLVATDVAARGIDVDRVDLVLQDDLPTDDDTYIHRVAEPVVQDALDVVFSWSETEQYATSSASKRKLVNLSAWTFHTTRHR